MKRAAAAVLAGLLIAVALPPWGWWPLAVAGIGLWGWLLVDLDWKSRLGVGALVGLSHFVIALAWVPEFTLPGYPLLVLLETAFWMVASLIVRGRWAPVGLAGALTLAEAGRYNSPFEGLPLAGVDLGQVGGPFLQAARLGGGYAVTLSAGLLGAALALALAPRWAGVGGAPRSAAAGLGRPAAKGIVALVPAALAVLLPVAGFLSPDGRTIGDPLRAAVVQGGGPVGFRGVHTDFGEVFARHLKATSTIRKPVDLVLWPENSLTVDGTLDMSEEQSAVFREMNRMNAVLVIGVVEDAGPDAFWNRAYLFDPAADPESVTKAIRVPFGEYIPFRSFVDRFADLSAIPTEAMVGEMPGILRSYRGRFAVSISYEVLFAERSREAMHLGAELILVPTNAASFRRTQVPGQELAAARLRAVETGRWLLQAAPTGYSAIVDHRGVVKHRSGISEQSVLRDEVPRRIGSTPFVTTGPWTTLYLALALVVATAVAARKRRDETSADTPAETP